MKNILVTIPVEDFHKTKLEDAVAGISDSQEKQFIYVSQKEVTREMVESAEVILGNVPPSYLQGAESLKLMQLDSAGAANYTKSGVLPAGVKLANATGAYGMAISEHMLGTVLMLMKKLNKYQDNMRIHSWKDEGQVKSIADSVTLVVGLGDIGGQFAKKMHMLGSRVFGVRKNKAEKPDYLEGLYQMDDLDDLLGKADIVACSLPGTEETAGMFHKERLRKIKKGGILINVGRGSLIPTDDLCEVLKSGALSGAAIDVTETEPLPSDSPLWDAPNLLITPHISGNYHMQQILETIVDIAAYNLREVYIGGSIKNEVDFQTGYRKFYHPTES